MGFPTTLSMNLVPSIHCHWLWVLNQSAQGMLIGWGILSPISKHAGWAPGPVGDMSSGARGWILWISLAIMCADSLVSLLPVIAEYFMNVFLTRRINGGKEEHDLECETEDRLVPIKWSGWGVGVSIIVGTLLVWLVFGHEGIKPWATLTGFVMGGLLSLLG